MSVLGTRSSSKDVSHRRWHPAWTMLGIAAAALVAAGSFTTIAGLITGPLVEAKGWSRADIGIGVALNMILYGGVAPFASALMDRYGLRRVTALALTVLITSSLLITSATPNAFAFVLWWGLLVGVGTGSITMVFGATVANRWFHEKIGFATGLLTAASVVGQFAMLPLLSVALNHGDWRTPVTVCGALAAAALIGVLALLKDTPKDVGTRAYGADDNDTNSTPSADTDNPFLRTLRALRDCLRDGRFWILALMFALCGATTNGLMWSHFTPAAHDHGITATLASSLLAVIGLANIAGTVTAGWLTDRIEPKLLLALFFFGRSICLGLLPILFAGHSHSSLLGFAVVFGILDVATVPPTLALCRHYFGDNSALAFGWVNVFHQIGAGSMALAGGLIRDLNGTYTPMWITSAIACIIAAILGLTTAHIHQHGEHTHHTDDNNGGGAATGSGPHRVGENRTGAL